jgi:twitching motility protein PilT
VKLGSPLPKATYTQRPIAHRKLSEVIAAGVSQYAMQTFDQSLMSLYMRGLITYETALQWCTNPDDFALRVRGVESSTDAMWQGTQEDASKTIPGITRL